MYISSINQFYPTTPIKQNRVAPQTRIQPPQRFKPAGSPSFCGLDLINRLLPSFTFRLKNFSISEYNKLTELEKYVLRKQYDSMVKNCTTKRHYIGKPYYENLEILHDYLAENLKNDFDKKYGEGKYKVIIIGRSLSSVGKVLGYKIGEENVVNVPLSLAFMYKRNAAINQLNGTSNRKNFIKFLNDNGLSRHELAIDNKKYILIDYCMSGNSLRGAKNLFDSALGNKKKIFPENVLKHVKDKKTKGLVHSYLQHCAYKDYSFVEKSYCLGDEKNCIVNTKKVDRKTKLVWFKLLDNEMTGANRGHDPLLNQSYRQ